MTMTLQQVPDRLRAVDHHGLSADACDELADAIDAHLAGMGEPVVWVSPGDLKVAQEHDGTVIVVLKARSDLNTSPLFSAPPASGGWDAVREVIEGLRQPYIGRYPAFFIDKLTAALPENAK